MNAAVVKLDSLTDAIRPAPKHHDLVPVFRMGFALMLISRIKVCRRGSKLPRTGVDPFVYRTDAQFVASGTNFRFADLHQAGETRIRKTVTLEAPKASGIDL